MASRNIFNALLVCLVLGIALVLASPMAEISSLAAGNASQSLELSPTEASLHDKRTVWNIVWSCITTIVACCWVAVHPNMLPEDATYWQTIFHRLIHMVWMIIAPELIICWAIRQWVGARNLMQKDPFKRHNEQFKEAKDKQWTMTHGFFLQMGCFAVKIQMPPTRASDQPIEKSEILTAKRLTELVDRKIISLPIVNAAEINDRSKRDEFSKLVAMGQTTWFIAQCLTRKAQGLVTTELELVTIAFAAANFFIYVFWWGKPLDTRTTVKVTISSDVESGITASNQRGAVSESGSGPSTKDTAQVSEKAMAANNWAQTASFVLDLPRKLVMTLIVLPGTVVVHVYTLISHMLFYSPPILSEAKKVPRFYALESKTSDEEHAIILAAVGIIGIFFGGVHCIGWNYFFPSHAETIIWRISSVAIVAVPGSVAFSAIALYANDKLHWELFKILGVLFLCISAAGVIPYIIDIARVLLLVEAFISLRNLPADALLSVRWTSFLPHF